MVNLIALIRFQGLYLFLSVYTCYLAHNNLFSHKFVISNKVYHLINKIFHMRAIEIFTKILKNSFLIILLWSLWISAEYWVFGSCSYMRVHDNAESMYTYGVVVSRIYSTHGPSAWIPDIASGIDHYIIGISNYFTYDFPLFALLPNWLVYSFVMFLQRFLATYFTYRLCRDFLKFNKYSAILAGIFWSLGTWSTNDWTFYNGLGLPLIPLYLYLLEICLKKSGWKRYVLASVVGLLLSYNSLFALFTPFFIVGSFIWLWVIRRHTFKLLFPVFLFFGLFSLCFEVSDLHATFLNAPFSGRVERGVMSYPISKAVMVCFNGIAKYFQTYLILWIITFIGLCITRFKDKLLLRLVGTTIGVVLISRILWFISVTNRETLGVLSVVNFSDFILIATFIPSVSAAYLIECISFSGKVLSIE